MLPFLNIALGQAAEPQTAAVEQPEIVVTASLAPLERENSPASVTIIDRERVEALGEPLTVDLLRLAPGISVASSGPAGSQVQLRIRGAEANHTLLLIDGIRFNDPASGNEARFELLSNDGVERIELVRGPQSALYGAEAIGGVVGIFTRGPSGVSASVEGGGKGFRRGSASGSFDGARAAFGIYGGYQQSDGIDSFADDVPGGERDGYDNLTFGASARVGEVSGLSASASGRFTEADSEYDGFDQTFARANTLDTTRNRIGAGRVTVGYGDPLSGPIHVAVGATLLGSTNRNRLDGDPLNKTDGRRTTVDALASTGLTTGSIEHRLIVAGDYEHERFIATDQNLGGGTDQRRTRDRGAVIGELRSRLADGVTTDIAVRHDSFEGFRDATTVRGAIVARVAGPVSVLLSYGTGIARPTFFDLFGFFPGSFVGNPAIRPEHSFGGEVGIRYDAGGLSVGLTGYRQRLRDEIVGVSDPVTFIPSTANASGTSRRQGIEVDATWRPSSRFGLSANYSYADAEEPSVSGDALLREIRRPRHSANIAADARFGPLTAGLSLAYVGRRIDTDFSDFPFERVRLSSYVLANARMAYALVPGVELFARVFNLFDADYQDVVGYATQGRTVYGGLRIRYGD